MKRTCTNNINRNKSIFNHMRTNNLVTPETLVNQIWLQEEDTSGVKIVELNSSSASSKESCHNNNYRHAWSYANNGRIKYDHIVDEEARRREEDNENFAAVYANQYCNRDMQSTNSFYETYDSEFNTVPISQMNCFTILNNQFLRSDSSTDGDNHDGVEVIEIDKDEDTSHWDHVYKDDIITYEPRKEPEKRTIWIYSYKNRRLLAENDFELLNIPSKDTSNTSTPYSTSDEEIKVDNDTSTCRIASPIPTTYVPRLNLSLVQTLSTVTEITEPNKSISKESHEVINIRPKNNWLNERNEVKKTEISNVVNWMGLSPRERRRRSINTNSEMNSQQNVKETEMTYAEGSKHFERAHGDRSSILESSTVQVQAQVHINENEAGQESLVSPKNGPKSNTSKIADIIPMKISFADADKDIDYNPAGLDYSKEPSIKIHHKFNKTEITEPIEKLDCDNWITEEKDEKETVTYEYDLEDGGEDANATVSSSENAPNSASRRLWMRNLKLMKGPQWAEYLPIACSPRCLHLSLSLHSLSEKKSWFKRLTECIKCCK